jgi:uncharacterized protein (TIGR00369 family)
MDEWIVRDGPDATCFGCGQANESGLRLRFRKTGDSSVEAPFDAPDHLRGAKGVLHGGIQATLLDEVMGKAAHVGLGPDDGRIVTADFNLSYRRVVHTGTALTVRGRLVRREDSNLFLEGEIVDETDTVLTTAQARWKKIG